MTVGLTANLNRNTIDFQSGTIAQKLNLVMEDIDNLKFMLDGMLDADLEALGYSTDEVTLLRTCINDMEELRNLYVGATALADAKDFRTFIRRIWGTGFASGQ